MEVPSLTAVELDLELKGENPPRLVDVREDDELAVSHLPGVIHIPVGELVGRFGELDPQENYVIVCRSGGRSGRATAFLVEQGYKHVRNLTGGMQGWAKDVDRTISVA
jgi:rhodanese-related sulfurtransferase